jgi:hypothetical protein
MTQVCSKCKVEKPLDDFHRDNSRSLGVQRYCKPCKSKSTFYDKYKKYKGRYVLYYLPKENYVGMTKNYIKRIRDHHARGKNTDNGMILISSKNKKIIHVLETVLHLIGFKGFRY